MTRASNWFWAKSARVQFLIWWSPVMVLAALADALHWTLPFSQWRYASALPMVLWLCILALLSHRHGRPARSGRGQR